MTYGERVKTARVALGLKQPELGELVGADAFQVSRIERGHTTGSKAQRLLIEHHLGVPSPPDVLDQSNEAPRRNRTRSASESGTATRSERGRSRNPGQEAQKHERPARA